MPHSMMDDDYRREMFLWALLFAFDARLSMIRKHDFHKAFTRYLSELEVRGISELGFYPDIVSELYPEVDGLLWRAVGLDILAIDNKGRAEITMGMRTRDALLDDQTNITPAELLIAKEAARITYNAYCSHTLEEKPAARAE